MKVTNYQLGDKERDVLSAMVVDSTVLNRIVAKWEPRGMFSSPVANIIAGWCVEYCRKHKQAPNKLIISLFRDWVEEGRKDEAVVKAVDLLLSALDYKALKRLPNPEYFIDAAGSHFEAVKLRRSIEDAQAHLDAGHLDKAKAAYARFSTIQLADDSGIDLFNDRDEIEATFADPPKSIVKYGVPAIDRFFESQLELGGFIAFIAPNKTGKSFWLMDFGWRAAVQNRRKVAFFLIGDMSKKQFNRRFYSRTAAHPYRNPTGEWPYEIEVPEGIKLRQGDSVVVADVERKTRRFKRQLDPLLAAAGCDRVINRNIKSNQTYFRFAAYPGRGVSTAGIRATLQQWETEGFKPDVIVIDYADNLAPVDNKADRRDQTNDTWLDLSAIRLERHCLLVTATQCDSKGFNKGWLTRDNFSEDRRKLDHASGFVGLNVSTTDKNLGITRLNWVNGREVEFGETDGCWVAGSLPICNPAMVARFPRGGDKVSE